MTALHKLLDAEVSRLRAALDAGGPRVSESYINGIEHAANLVYQAQSGPADAAATTQDAPVTIAAEHFTYLLQMARFGADHAPMSKTIRRRHLDVIENAARESNDLAARLKTLAEEGE